MKINDQPKIRPGQRVPYRKGSRELIYTLNEGRVVFEDWRRYYNTERPHRSLGLQTPAEFAKNQCDQGSGSSRTTPLLIPEP